MQSVAKILWKGPELAQRNGDGSGTVSLQEGLRQKDR